MILADEKMKQGLRIFVHTDTKTQTKLIYSSKINNIQKPFKIK